jgi:hypothetical protein
MKVSITELATTMRTRLELKIGWLVVVDDIERDSALRSRNYFLTFIGELEMNR